MTTHWTCTCGTTGTYTWAAITTKTDASLPDAKHQAACHGSVTTTTRAEWARDGRSGS
jgi:hypothetical protein